MLTAERYQRLSDCADTDSDHLCDTCGVRISDCADENRDHNCDICGFPNSYCEDTDADGICDICGWVYDEAAGDPANGIAPGTKFENLPEDFRCALCGVGKDHFAAE